MKINKNLIFEGSYLNIAQITNTRTPLYYNKIKLKKAVYK